MDMNEKVIHFIADFFSVDPATITPDTLINDELGIDGDDGSEFLLEFAEKFDVDITPICDTYFGPEGFSFGIFIWPVLFILNALGWKQKIFVDTTPLPVKVLIESAKAKKWIVS